MYEVRLSVTAEVVVILGVGHGLHAGDRTGEGGANRVRVVWLAVAGEGVHQLLREHVVGVAAVKVFDGGVGPAVVSERVLLWYLAPVGAAESLDPACGEVVVARGVVRARVDGRITKGVNIGGKVGKA